jgi:hypothetical protein
LVLPELPEEALPEPPPEVTDRQSSEAQWEHLLKELRDLAR